MANRILLGLLGILFATSGCSRTLVSEVRSYGLTPVSPVTNLNPGILIDPGDIWTGNPSILAEPGDAGIQPIELKSVWSSGSTPQLVRSHSEQFELKGSVSVPEAIKFAAGAKNAKKYSVSASGNSIQQVRILPFEELSKKYLNRFPGLLSRIEQNRVAYIQKVWVSRSIEYKFYTESGASVDFDLSELSIPVGVSGKWSRTSEGTYSFTVDSSVPPEHGIIVGISVGSLPSPPNSLLAMRPLTMTAPKKPLQ